MPIKTIEVQDDPQQLPDLLKEVAAGNEIILTKDNQPRARLLPIAPQIEKRVPNLHPGGMTMESDFDEPLPDEFWTGTP